MALRHIDQVGLDIQLLDSGVVFWDNLVEIVASVLAQNELGDVGEDGNHLVQLLKGAVGLDQDQTLEVREHHISVLRQI